MPEEREIPRIIEMNEDLTRDNEELAERNHKKLKKHNIKSIDVVGSIGSGKTSIISMIAEKFHTDKKIYVICGDITTRIDADRIEAHGAKTIQINTGRECALNAYHIDKVINSLPLPDIELLIIENVGNLICPSDFILGVDKRIVIMSVSEGDHVVIKHPLLVKMSETLIINKIDLVDAMDADLDRMIKDAKSINPNINVIPISVKTGENVEKILELFDV
ncbi:MAG: hydrogenase nickel incorporation protein HypB [Candidatus Lokiarchaeota archaeon]|nr:hydrogenase nickel incorporation protein HypB [Candidatus Lokiarchaeota archaeon]